MKIDKNIYDAIKKAIDHYGSKTAFAKAARIQKSMPNEYLRRWEKSGYGIIQDDTWERMYPALKKWLPSTDYYVPYSMRCNHTEKDIISPHDLQFLVDEWPRLPEKNRETIVDFCQWEIERAKKENPRYGKTA